MAHPLYIHTWILLVVGRTPWTGHQHVPRPLNIQDSTNTVKTSPSLLLCPPWQTATAGIAQSQQHPYYGFDNRGIRVLFPTRAKDMFLFYTASSSILGPTQPPIQWIPKVLSTGVKRPERKGDLTIHLHLVVRLRYVELYLQSWRWWQR
jgi:hypothetical protein